MGVTDLMINFNPFYGTWYSRYYSKTCNYFIVKLTIDCAVFTHRTVVEEVPVIEYSQTMQCCIGYTGQNCARKLVFNLDLVLYAYMYNSVDDTTVIKTTIIETPFLVPKMFDYPFLFKDFKNLSQMIVL